MIHRDIKPENILLFQSGMRWLAKLSDFGTARIMDEPGSTASTSIRGTPGYLDPYYAKKRKAGAYSDVFSFGTVILEMVSGVSPISDMDGFDAMEEHVDACCANTSTIDSNSVVFDACSPFFRGIDWSNSVSEHMGSLLRKAVLCRSIHVRERPSLREVKEVLRSCLGGQSNATFSLLPSLMDLMQRQSQQLEGIAKELRGVYATVEDVSLNLPSSLSLSAEL